MKYVFFLCLVMLSAGGTVAFAQTLNLVTKSGTAQIRTNDIDSVTIQTTTVTIIKKDRTTQVINIADLQRMTFTLTTGVRDAKQSSALNALSLLKAYPNPTNSTSIIEYQIVRPAEVEMQITDATGKIVKTVMLGTQVAGTHQVEWDTINNGGKTVTTGAYTCLIRTNTGEMLVQKLIIIH
jgi:flagellar hook assembly protein FlgD